MHFAQSQGELDRQFWLKNWPTVEEYVDFSHYNVWVPAQLLENTTTGATTMTNRQGVPVRVFDPTVSNNTTCYAFRRPRMWLNGKVTARLWYTGDLDSGHDAAMALGIHHHKEGSAINNLAHVQFTVPTPTADGVLMISRTPEQTTNVNYNRFSSDEWDLITVSLRRNGADAADTYVENIEVVGLEVIYREYRNANIGWKSNGISRWLMKK